MATQACGHASCPPGERQTLVGLIRRRPQTRMRKDAMVTRKLCYSVARYSHGRARTALAVEQDGPCGQAQQDQNQQAPFPQGGNIFTAATDGKHA